LTRLAQGQTVKEAVFILLLALPSQTCVAVYQKITERIMEAPVAFRWKEHKKRQTQTNGKVVPTQPTTSPSKT
jgi:hypothetical protein